VFLLLKQNRGVGVMATFADLPNELISKILHQTAPSDIEALSAISTNVHLQAARLLREHRELRKQYTILRTPASGSDEEEGNWLAGLLMMILHNPRIALYITELHLNFWQDSWDVLHSGHHSPASVSRYHLSYPTDMLEQFEETTRSMELILPREVDGWMNAIRRGDEDPIIALLLLHLPNLRSLAYELYCQPSQHKVLKTIRRIGEAKNQPRLLELKEVNLDYESRWEHTETCDLSSAFMSIPSVQSFRTASSYPIEDEDAIKIFLQTWASNVTNLKFTGGWIRANSLCEVIKKTKYLRSLTWDAYPDYGGEGVFDYLSISESLQMNASATLESLTLHSQRYGAIPLGSLRDLVALREISTEVAILFSSDGKDISTWPERLPPNIEKLTLVLEDDHIMQTSENFCAAFRCLLRSKKSLTPYLKFIAIRMNSEHHCREAYDHVQEPCSCAGILLRHDHPDGGGHMNASCGDCSDCHDVVENFLQESVGPDVSDSARSSL